MGETTSSALLGRHAAFPWKGTIRWAQDDGRSRLEARRRPASPCGYIIIAHAEPTFLALVRRARGTRTKHRADGQEGLLFRRRYST
jgi:hypothetical protein